MRQYLSRSARSGPLPNTFGFSSGLLVSLALMSIKGIEIKCIYCELRSTQFVTINFRVLILNLIIKMIVKTIHPM